MLSASLVRDLLGGGDGNVGFGRGASFVTGEKVVGVALDEIHTMMAEGFFFSSRTVEGCSNTFLMSELRNYISCTRPESMLRSCSNDL